MFFIVLFGFEKQIVLVTSVVPYLYCPPESHKKISDLSNNERNYLFSYHLNVYSKISKYLNINERKWLASHF